MTRLGEQLALFDRNRVHQSGAATTDQFFVEYGLARNPFPPARTIWPEILYNQEHAIEKVAAAMNDVVDVAPARRAVGIMGGTGEGKTHFLRHARLAFAEHCQKHGYRFAMVEFTAGTGKIQSLVREALDAADAASHVSGATDFVTALVDATKEGLYLNQVALAEVRVALQCLVAARNAIEPSRVRGRRPDFDTLRSIFRRWISGASLEPKERKYIGVSERISTGSMSVRVLAELFSLARATSVLHGLFLCLDEIETLFGGAQKMASVQSFLLDLRYLFDEASKYSLLLLAASTAEGADHLYHINPPVHERLGFQEGSRVQLRPIEGTLEAQSFALEYIRCERERAAKDVRVVQGRQPPEALLTGEEIKMAYRRAFGLRVGDPPYVSQSLLLNSLHEIVAEKHRRGMMAARST